MEIRLLAPSSLSLLLHPFFLIPSSCSLLLHSFFFIRSSSSLLLHPCFFIPCSLSLLCPFCNPFVSLQYPFFIPSVSLLYPFFTPSVSPLGPFSVRRFQRASWERLDQDETLLSTARNLSIGTTDMTESLQIPHVSAAETILTLWQPIEQATGKWVAFFCSPVGYPDGTCHPRPAGEYFGCFSTFRILQAIFHLKKPYLKHWSIAARQIQPDLGHDVGII